MSEHRSEEPVPFSRVGSSGTGGRLPLPTGGATAHSRRAVYSDERSREGQDIQ